MCFRELDAHRDRFLRECWADFQKKCAGHVSSVPDAVTELSVCAKSDRLYDRWAASHTCNVRLGSARSSPPKSEIESPRVVSLNSSSIGRSMSPGIRFALKRITSNSQRDRGFLGEFRNREKPHVVDGI